METMKDILDFLIELKKNNNKEWFDIHREQYKKLQAYFNQFVEQLINGIAQFDPTIKGLTVKDCTYRINRDIRFSKDKSPYKTHMGAYICREGKKSGYAGYYFHIEPHNGNLLNGSLLSVGVYMPEPKIIQSIREDIDFYGIEFEQSLQSMKNFHLNESEKLIRVPKGYDNNHPYANYLKQKDFYVEQSLNDDFLFNKNLLQNTINEFRETVHFANRLNRAIEFVKE